jgi:preprotein translocase subunit YajC
MSGILILALAYPAAIAVLFWLAFLRPVQQHQKKQRDELASLRVGDEVLTQAGFIALIKEIRVPEEHGLTEIILDLGGLEVRATASAIVQRLKPAEGGQAKAAGQRQPIQQA